jgi:hypothetical protein
MPVQTTNLFLLQDLEDVSRTGELAESDLEALQAVASWIKTFVAMPHKDLGRAGTVCPFVPGSLERKVLWLAAERIADRGEPDVVGLVSGCKRLVLETPPTGGDDADYKVIVVVFTDLPADRAQGVFDGVLQRLAVPSYAAMESCSGRTTKVLRDKPGGLTRPQCSDSGMSYRDAHAAPAATKGSGQPCQRI